ncbi:MAG: mechanosensitive ion channel [Gemmatimonadota bacterium]|nr:mechanosensitive ion channel [Gemmatimonadota bacterium]
MADMGTSLGGLFDRPLFTLGDNPITTTTLILAALLLAFALWGSSLLRRGVQRALVRRGGRADIAGTISGLVYYSALVMGVGLALWAAGIDLGALFAAGAIFAVGIGFAMQGIAQNFVAGVILVFERTIKPGDLLRVEGQLVKVVEMGIRACIAQTRDGEDLIIPNSVLLQTTVTNFTLRETTYRVRIPVGVTYGSDMALVQATLFAAAREVMSRWCTADREPVVQLTRFGTSSVDWDVGIWIDDPWELRVASSELHLGVWNACRRTGIVIAFPQLDLHLDRSVTEPLRLLAGRPD